MLRFEVRPFIRHVRNTEDMLEIQTDHFLAFSLDMLEIQRADHFLRFEVRPVIRHVIEIQRADHFLCYVSRSALSFDMLQIQRADHF